MYLYYCKGLIGTSYIWPPKTTIGSRQLATADRVGISSFMSMNSSTRRVQHTYKAYVSIYNTLLLLLIIIVTILSPYYSLFNIHIILLCWTRIVLLSIGYLSDIMRYYHIIDTTT